MTTTQNQDRAAQAFTALAEYREKDPVTRENVVDLLTDLRHLAQREGFDFDDAQASAHEHYGEEV